MRSKKQILDEINRSVPVRTQLAGFRNHKTGEWVEPDPIDYDDPVYDKETKLIAELLLDIREAILSKDV